MRKPDLSMLAPYLAANYELIPLHKPDTVSERHGKQRRDGKRPLDPNWTTRPYDAAAVAKRCAKEGRNVGVRLSAGQMVIDVDPRNFKDGNDSFGDLCLDLGLDAAAWPHVVTGSGGHHYYMTKPSDVPVLDSLDGYPGVEFKSKGRQVVSAGSIHPETGKLYEFDFAGPELSEAPVVPTLLLNLIRRPQRDHTSSGGGQYTQEQVAAMLDALDPTDFATYDKWLTLIMACHHASNGDARSEFLEWSSRDPAYADRDFENGRKWDSLHSDAGSRVTYRTLNKFLIDAGKEKAIPRDAVEDDFASVEGEDVVLPDEDADEATRPPRPHAATRGVLDRMNDKYCAVLDGAKFRVMTEQDDPTTGRRHWQRQAKQDFENFLANRKIERGDSVVPVAEAWLEWGQRRTCNGVIFDPSGRGHKGLLNLWTGWGVEAKKGSWARMQEMVAEVLCDGDATMYDYVMNTAARIVQRPDLPGEVAMCFQGGKGVGKSTFGNALVRIGGRHGLAIHSAALITGRFNAHLEDVVVLFADEAIRPQDKEAESRLKALITEPLLMFEGKGRDAKPAANRIHVIMAANEEWVVPASADERRYMVTRVSVKWRGKVAKWEALYAEMKRDGGQGYRAMLFDLLRHKIPDGWQPQSRIPHNKALMEQKMRSWTPMIQWWYEGIVAGIAPFQHRGDWSKGPIRVFVQDIRSEFAAYAKATEKRGATRSLDRFMVNELERVCPGIVKDQQDAVPEDRPDLQANPSNGRARAIVFPSHSHCKAEFARSQGSGGADLFEGADATQAEKQTEDWLG